MVDNSRVILEDNIEYLVIAKINDNDKDYVYLVNKDDESDIVIRKEVIRENEEHYLIGLDNEDEVEYALNLFVEKNKEN